VGGGKGLGPFSTAREESRLGGGDEKVGAHALGGAAREHPVGLKGRKRKVSNYFLADGGGGLPTRG